MHPEPHPPSMTIRAAVEADRAEAIALLRECALPVSDIGQAFCSAFVVATDEGAIVATAALEAHGRDGLLRSVAVRPSLRGRSIARALVAERIAHARRLGLRRVALLTTTAAGFFERLGFTHTDRALLSPELRACAQFLSVCPSSAACLTLTINPAEDHRR